LSITFVAIEEQAKFKRIENFLHKTIYKIPVDAKFGEAPLYEPDKHIHAIKRKGRPGSGRRR